MNKKNVAVALDKEIRRLIFGIEDGESLIRLYKQYDIEEYRQTVKQIEKRNKRRQFQYDYLVKGLDDVLDQLYG